MSVGLLFGMDTNITNRMSEYKTYKTANQYTITNAPQTTTQYSLGYNPQLNIGSPNANIGGSGGVNPISVPQVITTPSVAQGDAPTTTEAPMGAGTGNQWTNLIIVGVVAIAAVIILPKLLKGLGKSGALTKGLKL